MTNNARNAARDAEKARLIADGALCRVGLACAKMQVTQNLRPEALWHSALSHVLDFSVVRIAQLLAPGGARMQTVMPYVLAGFSLISRKKIIKTALGFGLAAAVAVTWLVRTKRK
jgi:hypothetical protein